MKKEEKSYQGLEVCPIRPPSEASSLMLRVTRNCPWNRCKFCGLYKGQKFSIRSVKDVNQDIDLIKDHIDQIKDAGPQALTTMMHTMPKDDLPSFYSADNWYRGGMNAVFLQDANTLIVKPDDLVNILTHLGEQFPEIQRITSYARSHTVARISDDDMGRLALAGLNRVHIGMESAADDILAFVKKGVDKKTHIKAGKHIKRAGIELSEYFMPGLGGTEYSKANALETADALNQINPDFIRIRTLAVTDFSELSQDIKNGNFSPLDDVETARELLLFFEHLDGITSQVRSDHILNLFQEVDGKLPASKDMITTRIKQFLNMTDQDQMMYRIGRRTGIFSKLTDLENPTLLAYTRQAKDRYGVTLDNLDEFTDTMIKQFI